MHDFSLGGPVDQGEYTGPTLNGTPLHKGNCEDGVYGCRKCNAAARNLSEEQLKEIGWPLTGTCDWCEKEVPTKDMCGHKAWDEPVYYEICVSCKTRANKEIAELERDMGYDDYDDDPPGADDVRMFGP